MFGGDERLRAGPAVGREQERVAARSRTLRETPGSFVKHLG